MRRSTLTDKEATGGDTALRGFEYQKAVMLAWLPGWLSRDDFSAVSYELLGDIEVKYFNASRGEVIDFYQVKDRTLKPTDLLQIVRDFKRKDEAAHFNHFYVVCSGLSPQAKPLGEDLKRIRRESPPDAPAFYPEDAPVKADTRAAFVERVVELGGDEALGNFILTKVSILYGHGITEANGEMHFKETLAQLFPEVQSDANIWRDISRIYNRVQKLITSRRGKPITRSQLVEAITDKGELRFPSFDQLEIHTAHDDSAYQGSGINLAWQPFFGGTKRVYPAVEVWNGEFVQQLVSLRSWIEANASTRTLLMTGQRRLSVNLALGWTFSAVGGFDLIHEHRGAYWQTNAHPNDGTPPYSFESTFERGKGDELIVSVAIKQNIATEVETVVRTLGFNENPKLHLNANAPLTKPDQVNLAVQTVKSEIAKTLADTGCNEVHLFLATPATFALSLGHRLNSLPPIQCYERRKQNVYVQSCYLS